MKQFVDISGFGHSGKSIITDLLKEFDGFLVPPYNFEFNLLRVQGGLLDLRSALYDDWSPIRSDYALKRFQKLINRSGPSVNFFQPATLFTTNGLNYDERFNEIFTKISNSYIQSLINFEYTGQWPYSLLEGPNWNIFFKRLLYYSRLKRTFTSKVVVTKSKDFLPLTRQYLYDLFVHGFNNENINTYVTHNAVDAYNPTRGLDLFMNGKVIIVQRDPRDIFASTSIMDNVYVPAYEIKSNWKLKQSFLNTSSVTAFVNRQKAFFSQVRDEFDDNRVLRLQFEDVVLNYEESLQKIYTFLNVDKSVHLNKGRYFNPELSAKNIGIWKRYKNVDDIKYIFSALKENCFLSQD